MNGQQLFHSFLPSVTAAVLTTQPAWAGTVKVNGVEFASSPSVVSSTYDRSLAADMIDTQPNQTVSNNFSDRVTVPSWTKYSLKPVIHQNIPVMETGLTSHRRVLISSKDQGQLLSLTPSSNSAQQLDQNPNSAENNLKQTNLKSVEEKSQQIFVPTFSSTPNSVQPETLPPSSSQQPVVQTVVSGTGTARLLEMSNCPQEEEKSKTSPSAALLVSSTTCFQKVAPREQVAQSNPPTTQPSVNFAPAGVVPTPATTPSKVNPAPATTPSNISPAPTGNVPTPATPPIVSPAPTDTGKVLDNLKPNPNPLQYPTKPEEVKLQGNQAITLAQALEVAKRNNHDLQVALLNLQGSQAALKAAQAALLPTFDINTSITRQRSASDTLTAKIEQQQQNQLPAALQTPVPPAQANTLFSGTAQLTYNLYTSGSRLAAIGAAEEQVRFNELAAESKLEDIRLSVATQYYNLQQADEQIRITQSAVKNAEASLRDAEALERAGVGTRFDVLRSQVNLANSAQTLTNAISQQQVARRQLATTLNVPQSVNISTADPVKLAGLWNQSLEQSIVLAYQNRQELQQQLAQRNISEQQRRQALASLGPKLAWLLAITF